MEHESRSSKNKSKKKSNMGSSSSTQGVVKQHIQYLEHKENKRMKSKPLSEEALAVFAQFPADVIEEILVRVLDLPSNRISMSPWKVTLLTCRQWHAIGTSNSFWWKATSLYFPEFIASAKHDPHISFVQEFRRLACQVYELPTMGITWLDENYWKTVTEEGIHPTKHALSDQTPHYIRPCDALVLPIKHARLDSVCWFDVRTYAKVSYPCRASLLACVRLGGGRLGPLSVAIHAGLKNIADDEPKWHQLSNFIWSTQDQENCPSHKWIYLELGTVDVANLDHGLETIELQGQIWSYSGDWKGGFSVSHLKCIQLPKH